MTLQGCKEHTQVGEASSQEPDAKNRKVMFHLDFKGNLVYQHGEKSK
jgi:hypothetical protein